jgi:molybdopterin-containing oxidoreductase family iron-sulfur binding subunit
MRYGMVIDLTKCVGCNACTAACKQTNITPPGVFWSKVVLYETGSYPQARLHFLPMLCMHCQDAPCLEACPTGATYRGEGGLVLVDDDRCVGCRYCIMACPYEARSYNTTRPKDYYPGQEPTVIEVVNSGQHPKGAIEKCNFCAPRLREGKLPACVATCPAEARIFGDLDDPGSEVSKLVASGMARPRLDEQGTNPSVFYIEVEPK